jgi:carbon monoxide dehydrogenase subunit G
LQRESVFTEYEPNRKITQKSTSGSVPFEVQLMCEPVEGGTRLIVIAEAQPRGLFKLVGPLLVRLRKRQFASDLANLKAMIEANAF